MEVVVTGADLSLGDLVRVARGGTRVELSGQAVEAMTEASSLAEHAFELGLPVYGLTTGLGAQKRTSLERDDAGFGWRQIAESRAGVGPEAPPDAVRAAMLVFLNQMAGGSTCLRPVLAERLAQALNEGLQPPVRLRGSLGASDLAPMADLARGVFGGMDLAPGEGLALMNSSAFGTGLAALAVADAVRLVVAADVAAALCLEGFAANRACCTRRWSAPSGTPCWRAPSPASASCSRGATSGRREPPATCRTRSPTAARLRSRPPPGGLCDHALSVVRLELNAAQGNPLVSVEDGRILSTSAYEVVGLSAALDYARIGLATMLSAASERSVKLLDTPWSGLPTGLLERGGPDLGLSILAITAQSVVAEAFTLAQPVSFTVASSAGAEGIEDRASHLVALRAPARGDGRARRRRRGHRAPGVGAGGGRARVRAARPPDGSGVRAHPAGRADHEGRGRAAGGREPREQAHPHRGHRLTRRPRLRGSRLHAPRTLEAVSSHPCPETRAHRLAPSMCGLRIVGRLLHIGGGT